MTPRDLAAIEQAFQRCLRAQEPVGLRVLGYGEISTVLACRTSTGEYAVKRLPVFEDETRLEGYRTIFEAYQAALGRAGIWVVPTDLMATPAEHGLVGYCVQPVLDPEGLGDRYLSRVGPEKATAFFESVLDRIFGSVTARLGLDAQVSNWWVDEGELHYLDITTPFMRGEAGDSLLDVDLFLASLPGIVRGGVKTFLVDDILETYHDPRSVVVDVLANLHKERLDHLIPGFVERSNARLERAITEREVLRYYRADARTWTWIQALRRLDRWWQRVVRRRVYPFLLPGPIARHV